MSPILEGYLTEQESADALHKTPRTLQSWRQQGIGPAYVKIGKTVFYERSALLAWVKAQQHEPVRGRRAA
jgi:Helix-turn-helix domain